MPDAPCLWAMYQSVGAMLPSSHERCSKPLQHRIVLRTSGHHLAASCIQVRKLHSGRRQRQPPNPRPRQRTHSGRSSSSASMCGGCTAPSRTCCRAAPRRRRCGTPLKTAMSGACRSTLCNVVWAGLALSALLGRRGTQGGAAASSQGQRLSSAPAFFGSCKPQSGQRRQARRAPELPEPSSAGRRCGLLRRARTWMGGMVGRWPRAWWRRRTRAAPTPSRRCCLTQLATSPPSTAPPSYAPWPYQHNPLQSG